MDSLKGSIAELMAQFHDRMAKFEAELAKPSPSASPSSSTSLSLAADYAVFKKFVLDALGCLERQVEALAKDVDALEMRGRRKMLLLHGVDEVSKEETSEVVAEVFRNNLKLDTFCTAAIRRCHRMGSQGSAGKPRAILIKLQDVDIRDKVWFAKTKLKGSGITLSEFLTRSRHQVFMKAREKFGVTNCWTKLGYIHVLGADGSKHRVVNHSELNAISVPELHADKAGGQPQVDKPLSENPASTPAAKRNRRPVAKK